MYSPDGTRIVTITHDTDGSVSIEQASGAVTFLAPGEYQAWYAAYARARAAHVKGVLKMENTQQAPTDDIRDPAVPPAVVAGVTADAAADAAPGQVSAEIRDIVAEAMLNIINDARARLAALSLPSETAEIQARTPEGYIITLVTRKASTDEAIEVLGKMRGWLHGNGFTGV